MDQPNCYFGQIFQCVSWKIPLLIKEDVMGKRAIQLLYVFLRFVPLVKSVEGVCLKVCLTFSISSDRQIIVEHCQLDYFLFKEKT